MDHTFKNILKAVRQYGAFDEVRLQKAYEIATEHHAGQTRSSGDPYISHPLAVMEILTRFEADEDTLIAALLHDLVEDTAVDIELVEKEFGKEVAKLVEALTKISFSEEDLQTREDKKFASLRKLFEAAGRDIRALLIKLCDRLHNVQTLGALTPEKRMRIARETLEIYVPFTERFNLGFLRRELLQGCYEILAPELLHTFTQTQQENAARGEQLRKKTLSTLKKLAPEIDSLEIKLCAKTHVITGEETVENLKGLEISETHRHQILVGEEAQCYQVLFLLHKIYRGQPNSFRDYISTPKENGYQALHTKVIDDNGNIIHFQILTKQMARIAECGVAAFWQGKEENMLFSALAKLPIRIKWLQDLATYSANTAEASAELGKFLQQDFLKRRMSVFDAAGKAFDLPKDATVLDFLYNYYPDIAGYVENVTVNKEVTSLKQMLIDGDKVEFSIGKSISVDVRWLSFVKTYTAKKHIQADLDQVSVGEKIQRGEALLQREFDAADRGLLKRYNKRRWRKIAQTFGGENLEQLLQFIGEGKIKAAEIFQLFFNSEESAQIFRCRIIFAPKFTADSLNFCLTVAQKYHVTISKSSSKKNKIILELKTSAESELEDFFEELEQHPGVVTVRRALPLQASWKLISSWAAVMVFFIFLFLGNDLWQQWISEQKIFLMPIFAYIPFLVLVTASFITIKILQNYSSWMRAEKRFVAASILLNTLSFLVSFSVLTFLHTPFNTLILLALLCLSVLWSSQQYIATAVSPIGAIEPYFPENIPAELLKKYQRKKLEGYIFRALAVTLWGTTPVVVKYFLPEIGGVKITVMSLSAAFLTIFPVFIFRLFKQNWRRQKWQDLRKLLFIILFDGLFLLMYFLSISFTSASNTVLFINFAPVVAIIFALLFLKSEANYFKRPSSIRALIIIFLLGTVGTSLLIINTGLERGSSQLPLLGDFFGFLAVVCDVLATVALIRYAKLPQAITGKNYILAKIGVLGFFSLPFSVYLFSSLSFSARELALLLYAGIFGIALAWYCAYEAYKRLDGFVNYLLMNLAPIITLSLETVFFDLPLSVFFVIGGIFILISSIAGEYISVQHEKRELYSQG